MTHPRLALFDAGDLPARLPVCDHYAGVPARMHKSLALQAELGPVFDVTLDCEDGAPVGAEREHAAAVAELIGGPDNRHGRVGVRVHPADHPSFRDDLNIILRSPGQAPAYIMVPKLRDVQQAREAVACIDEVLLRHGVQGAVPVHGLIETHGGLRDVMAIAALPRIESLSFGLMDFVSAHRGAVPASAMTSTGQFTHPLVVRAKLEISAACHAHGKTPSHAVVTEFTDHEALAAAARRAQLELGYTRMWSIHPDQVRVIVQAFAPATHEVDQAGEILMAAYAADWAPIRHRGADGQDHLHDRASYRYYWHVLERARHTGMTLNSDLEEAFFGSN